MEVAKRLAVLLADVHCLYIKTLGFHWNVVDKRFSELHAFFESIYKMLAEDLDEVAERIRKLQQSAPASVGELAKLSRLKDAPKISAGDEMIRHLLADFEALVASLKSDIAFADDQSDPGTADLLTGILRAYEKRAWMLRSFQS